MDVRECMNEGSQRPEKPRPDLTANPPVKGQGPRFVVPAKSETGAVPFTKLPKPPKPSGEARDSEVFSRVLRVQGGDKYKVGAVVAEGGMGIVREAFDMTCKRVVAIKEISKNRSIPPEDLSRFIEEAQITSQLEHPNIVPIHEVGFDSQQNAFYAMKFVKGVTLTEVLLGIRKARENFAERYPLSRLLNVFQKVCDAVAFAHWRGIAHCDLKPDNIMICDFGEVMLMDWGLAQKVGSPLPVQKGPACDDTVFGISERPSKIDSTTRTTTGRILGTPGFIAPERISGGELVDIRSDIYSLGATLYSILTLRPPVTGADINDVLRKILTGDIRSPVAWNDELPQGFPHCPEGKVPPALSEVVMTAMSLDAADRYASVKDLQQEVEAYQNGQIWHVVVDQDFTGEDPLARWDVLGGVCEVKNGELLMSLGEPQILALKADLPIDVRIEFEAREENVYLNSIGCFVSATRNVSPKEMGFTGYKFELGGFDNSADTLDRAGRQIARRQAASIERGKNVRICLERVGNRLRVVIDGHELFNVVDPDPLSGSDRTAIGLFGWLAECYIKHIKISTLGAPWKSDILDLAERQSLKGNYDLALGLVKEVIDSYPEPARLARARKTEQMIVRRKTMAQEIEEWRGKLSRAWPGAPFDLRATNDGFILVIENCGIEDLSPIRGLPLIALNCPSNRIQSLEPLRGMPLTSLTCSGNPITSLEPLRGMPLTTVVCEGCPIESLEPLRGMPVTMVNIGGARVRDLDPLRGMSLTFLSCWGNQITCFDPLAGMKNLSALYCSANQVESLEPLRGLSLVSMNCSGNRISDLEPLRGLPLGVLHCGDNNITSLEPLAGLPLKMLSCQANRITTLEPLRGMPFASLVCGANPLTSCEPFVEIPPDDFRYDSDAIPTSELKRVRDIWRERKAGDLHVRHIEILLAARELQIGALKKMASEFKGHRYLFMPKFLTWDEARVFCEKLGGHLLTVSSQEEHDFINAAFPNGSWFWLGLKTTERGHEWVTGEPFDYNNFVGPQQERKLGPKIFSGRWTADDYPAAHHSFMIEWDD